MIGTWNTSKNPSLHKRNTVKTYQKLVFNFFSKEEAKIFDLSKKVKHDLKHDSPHCFIEKSESNIKYIFRIK